MARRLSRFLRSREIVCRDAVELVTAYLEGQLRTRDRVRFEAHLAACPHCTAYVEQMRSTITVLRGALPEPVDAETRDELVELYRRWQAG
jgi:anti-sigma factor RsiW